MLGLATAAAIAAIAAGPAPQQLVLTQADVPTGYRLMTSASGQTAPNAYRAAFARGSTARLSSVAVVFTDPRAAAAQVAAPSANCGTGGTKKLPGDQSLGNGAVVCASTGGKYVAYAVVWRHGRVFATLAIVGRRGEVSPKLALRLAHAQEARIARARAGGPPAA